MFSSIFHFIHEQWKLLCYNNKFLCLFLFLFLAPFERGVCDNDKTNETLKNNSYSNETNTHIYVRTFVRAYDTITIWCVFSFLLFFSLTVLKFTFISCTQCLICGFCFSSFYLFYLLICLFGLVFYIIFIFLFVRWKFS